MFTDRAKITVKSGNGGNGAVAFHREKYVNAGGPDGGDGGNGGSIIFAVDSRMSTLIDFRYKRKYVAQSGDNGGVCKMTGKSAPDLVIGVPSGTLIYDNNTGKIIADMVEGSEPKVIARGGKGGLGNQHFATSTRQIPNFARAGEEGVELELRLELKLLADVGLVGFPSVGKSTILASTTAARPEIAEYHFTTLQPNLGVVFNTKGERSFVLADIPGLIEGASEGVGLGHEFLRHIERTRLLLHVIDIAGTEGRDPFEDFITIESELLKFNEELAQRPQIIVLNKADMLYEDDKNVDDFTKKFDKWLKAEAKKNPSVKDAIANGAWKIFKVSAAISQGMEELMLYTASILDKFPAKVFEVEVEDNNGGHKYYGNDKGEKFTCSKVSEGVYSVEGMWIKNLAASINMTDEESSMYFQTQMRKNGVFTKLRELGIQDGDSVRIYDFEFDFVD